jgi:hypothetical protein
MPTQLNKETEAGSQVWNAKTSGRPKKNCTEEELWCDLEVGIAGRRRIGVRKSRKRKENKRTLKEPGLLLVRIWGD